MTVQELIDKLSEMPRDMTVCVKTYRNELVDYAIDEADEVEIEDVDCNTVTGLAVTIFG